MNNLTKSVLIVNQLLGALLGSNFTTPMQQTIDSYPDIRYLG